MDHLHSIDSFGIKKVSLSHIRIERLEDRIKPGVPFPHKHDFFQVLLVVSGTGEHRIDFEKHPAGPGSLFMMKPGQMHSWKFEKGIKGYLVEFSTQSLNAIKDGSRLITDFTSAPDAHKFANKRDFAQALKLTELMIDEFSGQHPLHDLCLQGYLSSFLILLIRSYQTSLRPAKALSTIEKFKNLVEKNFKTAHNVEFYAKLLNTSNRALTMQLSRSIGKPPRQIIQERILLEAKRYLSFSERSIAEIGFELGFDDANYFTRFFKQHVRKTPAQFRKLTES